jgi:prephenate dehydrogenase
LITDAGSTKGSIVAELEKSLPSASCFLGSHPLAGSEKQGPAEAKANLLEGRVVVITPTAKTQPEVRSAIEEFWTSLGAKVIALSPEVHDQRLAASSHVPHIVAALLARSTPEEAFPFVAGGFRDTTRIAGGDPDLWTQILLANRAEILKALAPLESNLAALQAALDQADGTKIRDLLTEAKRKRDALGS